MKTVKSTELHDHIGEFIDEAWLEPITITRYGRPRAVLMSPKLYDHLRAMEDEYLLRASREAEAEGYLSVEETHRALNLEPPPTLKE